MKVFAYRSALCTGWKINLMFPKVVKHNGAHELFMNTYVVVGQQYYYIDTKVSEMGSLYVTLPLFSTKYDILHITNIW